MNFKGKLTTKCLNCEVLIKNTSKHDKCVECRKMSCIVCRTKFSTTKGYEKCKECRGNIWKHIPEKFNLHPNQRIIDEDN